MAKQPTDKPVNAGPKQFYIPPDIRALGSYANVIIESMRKEHARRRD